MALPPATSRNPKLKSVFLSVPPPFPPNGGEGGVKDESSCSFFLDTKKEMEIDLLLLEGELHPASFIRESNIK